MVSFTIGSVSVEILSGIHAVWVVPPSAWHGDRKERAADAVLANLRADDGLRAQVSLLRWNDDSEVSLGYAEIFAGPSDYQRLEDAGTISPKVVGENVVARIRALRYGAAGRATSAAVEWSQLDEWAGEAVQSRLLSLGASRTGTYGELLPAASRFKTEPAVEVPYANPAALFAIYALTRVVPIMTGNGRASAEGPNE